MDLDLKKVDRGQQLAAIGAAALFVLLFVGWYSFGGAFGAVASKLGVDVSINGWDAHTSLRWLMLLTIVAAIGFAFLAASGREVRALPVPAGLVVAGLAGLTAVFLAYRMLIDQPGPDRFVDLKAGAWLALASLVLVAVGGWRSATAGR